jgi:hypothetical protein
LLKSLFPENRYLAIGVIAGTGLLAVLIVISVILLFTGPGTGQRAVSIEDPSTQKPSADNPWIDDVQTRSGDSPFTSSLKTTDFYLDDELEDFFHRETYPARDPSSVWKKAEVDKYFIPVDEILYEYFQKTNDNYIKEIFSTVD